MMLPHFGTIWWFSRAVSCWALHTSVSQSVEQSSHITMAQSITIPPIHNDDTYSTYSLFLSAMCVCVLWRCHWQLERIENCLNRASADTENGGNAKMRNEWCAYSFDQLTNYHARSDVCSLHVFWCCGELIWLTDSWMELYILRNVRNEWMKLFCSSHEIVLGPSLIIFVFHSVAATRISAVFHAQNQTFFFLLTRIAFGCAKRIAKSMRRQAKQFVRICNTKPFLYQVNHINFNSNSVINSIQSMMSYLRWTYSSTHTQQLRIHRQYMKTKIFSMRKSQCLLHAN